MIKVVYTSISCETIGFPWLEQRQNLGVHCDQNIYLQKNHGLGYIVLLSIYYIFLMINFFIINISIYLKFSMSIQLIYNQANEVNLASIN